MMLVEPTHLESKSRGEVFLVTNDHVNQRSKSPVDLLRFCLAANRFPERRPIVQIVRNDRSRALRRRNGLFCHERSRLGERTENTTGVEPAHAILRKNLFPVDFAGLELRHSGLSAVGTSHGRANTEAALGEVQPIARRPADSIKRYPANILLADASLKHQIFHETSDGIIGEGSDD